MNDESKIFVNKLESHCESGESFNIANKVTLCALDIICQTAMGCSIHAQDNEESEYVKALFRFSTSFIHLNNHSNKYYIFNIIKTKLWGWNLV